MKNLYYLLWIDSIKRIQFFYPKKKNWKIEIWFLNTWMNTLNLWIIFIWLKYYDICHLPLIHVEIFPGEMLNAFVSFSIEFATPFGLLNYFMIFHNKRYKKLLKRFEDYKVTIKPRVGGIAFIYSISIVIMSFITALLFGKVLN